MFWAAWGLYENLLVSAFFSLTPYLCLNAVWRHRKGAAQLCCKTLPHQLVTAAPTNNPCSLVWTSELITSRDMCLNMLTPVTPYILAIPPSHSSLPRSLPLLLALMQMPLGPRKDVTPLSRAQAAPLLRSLSLSLVCVCVCVCVWGPMCLLITSDGNHYGRKTPFLAFGRQSRELSQGTTLRRQTPLERTDSSSYCMCVWCLSGH